MTERLPGEGRPQVFERMISPAPIADWEYKFAEPTHRTDDEVAMKVMGWTRVHDGLNYRWQDAAGSLVDYWNGPGDTRFAPSTYINKALPVVEEMRAKGWMAFMAAHPNEEWEVIFSRSQGDDEQSGTGFNAAASSLPLAICKAALSALDAHSPEKAAVPLPSSDTTERTNE